VAAKTMAENRLAAQRKQQGGAANVGSTNAKITDAQARVAKAESELAKAQKEKADMQAKLQASESQLAQKTGGAAPDSISSSVTTGQTVAELQAQLDEARQQLENAEREKLVVSEKIQSAEPQPHSTAAVETKVQRRRASEALGLHGTILAVNQAYNFVVLDLGGRQGVETNAEMVIMRGGTLIGKIRVSSVEPATAIGDIISSTLPRGVQVQPGDIVIYAGTDS
jgi:chromosome segregation ATPase